MVGKGWGLQRVEVNMEPHTAGSASSASGVSWPLVSVVVPTRGRPDLLRRALVSIVGQTYPGPIECVVVHDQEAPDLMLTELGSPSRRIVVTTNDRTPGLAGARNSGRARTAGDYIASCDDDDRWHPRKLEIQMRWLGVHEEVWVVGAGIRLMMPGNHVVSWPGKSAIVSQSDLVRSRMKELHSSTLLARRATFDRVGGYDESLPFGYAEDYEWLLRAVRLGPLGVVTTPLADVAKDGRSWFRERQPVVAEGLTYLLRTHPELARSRRGGARLLGQIAFAHAVMGDRKTAMTWAVRSLRRWPFTPHALLTVLNVATGVDPAVSLKAARVMGRGIS
jgi:glycosyltransferase involved in cell wall biosynthesis